MLEIVEGYFLSVLLRAWAQACIRILDLCVRRSILANTGLFLRLCVHGCQPTYPGPYLHTWALTHVHEMLGRFLTLPIFNYFLTVSILYAILTPLFFVIFAPKHYCILLFIFILASKTSFFILFSSFVVLIPLCQQGKHQQGGGVVQPPCSRNQG